MAPPASAERNPCRNGRGAVEQGSLEGSQLRPSNRRDDGDPSLGAFADRGAARLVGSLGVSRRARDERVEYRSPAGGHRIRVRGGADGSDRIALRRAPSPCSRHYPGRRTRGRGDRSQGPRAPRVNHVEDLFLQPKCSRFEGIGSVAVVRSSRCADVLHLGHPATEMAVGLVRSASCRLGFHIMVAKSTRRRRPRIRFATRLLPAQTGRGTPDPSAARRGMPRRGWFRFRARRRGRRRGRSLRGAC